MNILIIDNSVVFHKMLGDICSSHGMTPIFCETAAQGLETIKSHSFDFICLSMHLEDSNGIDLAKQLRTTTHHHYIPIILFTSDSNEDNYTKALTAGITEVFLKKDIDQLLHFIQRFTLQQQPLSGRVLYIEDSLSQQQFITTILTSHGLDVDAFDNAEEAWQAYLTYDYDMVATDIVLSGNMSGLELTNRIRRIEGVKGDIPILAMTSFDDISRRIELFYIGVSDYVIKPIIEEELIARIRILIKRKKMEEKLHLIAYYDALTTLPNRILFADRYEQSIAHCKRTNSMLAVCFLDLDDFKSINDSFGHEIGDQLLISVANRLKQSLREGDTASRQGGDEFALLLNDIGSVAECKHIMSRLHDALSQSYVINDITLLVGVSSGFTLYPSDNVELDTLLRHADHAMYQAKLAGKNRFQLFNYEHNKKFTQQAETLNEVEQALANNHLQLYFQPKVNMRTGEVFGAEALIRWNHPEKGLIPPLDFLPLLEETELEVAIGNWVIKQALAQLNDWLEHGFELEVSINVSPYHLNSATFFTTIKETLERYPNVNSCHLQLEILESMALGDIDKMSQLIKTCQDELGIRVALDDFGTGYSSLAHLRCLPVQTIKVDQSFVRDILDDPNDYAIIDGIIGLADAFNREVIAEGVETSQHGLMLLSMGCNEAQGYGIARPMPAEEFSIWLEAYQPNSLWIDYASRHYSSQENKIALLQLTTEHWYQNIIDTLTSNNFGDAGNYLMKCHLGKWISRFKKEGTFTTSWLNKLQNAHDVFYTLANEVVLLHHIGETGNAIAKQQELETAYLTVHQFFEQKHYLTE